MSVGDFVQLQDKKVTVNLETLVSVSFVPPAFHPLTDLSISSLIYHGDMSSLFHGKFLNNPAIIETCTRIPFRLVCRELTLLNELNIKNIVQVSAVARNASLGIISIAYKDFSFQPWTELIPQDHLPQLLLSLLTILSQLHAKNVFHGWICRSSIYVSPDFKDLTLGSFHAASKIGEAAPLIPNHPCSPPSISGTDRRADDVYSAAIWFLSFYTQNPQQTIEQSKLDSLSIQPDILDLIKQMTHDKTENRIKASEALKKLQSIVQK